MARFCLVLTGPASSTASPTTLMMRPSVSLPTGTSIGSPVSVTSWPRTRPSDESTEMLRYFEHQAVAAIFGLERVEDRRQVILELDVDDGADDLRDSSDCVWC